MKNLFALPVLAVILVFSGCQEKPSESSGLELFPGTPEGQVVAEFDGVKITDKYLNAFIKELPPRLKGRYNTPKQREGLLLKILEGEMLARAAFKEGMVNDPALLVRIKSAIALYYKRNVLGAEISKKTEVSEEEMREFYEKNRGKYDQPPKRRASHILVKVSEKASKEEHDKTLAKAGQILEEVKKESDDRGSFARLAKKFSDDIGSKIKGGDVGYFSRTEDGGRMVIEFTDAAFALSKKGDISDVVRSKFGYHIIKLTGKRDAVSKSYEEMKPRTASTLKAMKRKSAYESAIKDMEKKMKFHVNKEAVAAIDFGVSKDIKKGPAPPSPR